MPRNRGKMLSACGAKHDFLLVLYSEDTSIVQLGTRFAALKTAVVGAASVPGPLDENFADPQTTVAALVPVNTLRRLRMEKKNRKSTFSLAILKLLLTSAVRFLRASDQRPFWTSDCLIATWRYLMIDSTLPVFKDVSDSVATIKVCLARQQRRGSGAQPRAGALGAQPPTIEKIEKYYTKY